MSLEMINQRVHIGLLVGVLFLIQHMFSGCIRFGPSVEDYLTPQGGLIELVLKSVPSNLAFLNGKDPKLVSGELLLLDEEGFVILYKTRVQVDRENLYESQIIKVLYSSVEKAVIRHYGAKEVIITPTLYVIGESETANMACRYFGDLSEEGMSLLLSGHGQDDLMVLK